MAESQKPGVLGALLGDGAKIMAHQLMQGVLNNTRINEYVAKAMQADEDPGIKWDTLSKADRAMWKLRSTSAINALLKMF